MPVTRFRLTTLITLIFSAFFCATVQGHELSVLVKAPDSEMDSMHQQWTLQTDLSPSLHLYLGAAERVARNTKYAGITTAAIEQDWQLDESASLKVLVGRATANWSLWDGTSVILSDHAPGFDQVQYAFTRRGVTVEKVIGRLSGQDRYLLGHRLTIRVGNLIGSIGETVVSSGNFAENPISLVPWPYYWTQWVALQSRTVHNNEVNAHVFLQGAYKNSHGLILGAELLIDDMPQWFGVHQMFQAGGQVVAQIPIYRTLVRAQYTRVNNFTYSFQDESGHYTHHDYVLGFPSGPDVDEFRLSLDFPRALLGFTEAGLVLRRKGTGNIGDVWEFYGYEQSKDLSFLSGIVEATQFVYVQGEYPLTSSTSLTAQLGVGPVQNAKNVVRYNKVAPDGFLQVQHRF